MNIALNLLPVLQIEEPLGLAICGGATIFLFILPIIIAIAIGVWLYKDAEKRGKSGALWLIIGLIANIIGLIIWLIVRPSMDEVRRKRQQEQQYQQQQYKPPEQD